MVASTLGKLKSPLMPRCNQVLNNLRLAPAPEAYFRAVFPKNTKGNTNRACSVEVVLAEGDEKRAMDGLCYSEIIYKAVSSSTKAVYNRFNFLVKIDLSDPCMKMVDSTTCSGSS